MADGTNSCHSLTFHSAISHDIQPSGATVENQETSQAAHAHPMDPTGPSRAAPGSFKPLNLPALASVPAAGGSTRSMPEETMNASNRTASKVLRSSSISGIVYYQTAVWMKLVLTVFKFEISVPKTYNTANRVTACQNAHIIIMQL